MVDLQLELFRQVMVADHAGSALAGFGPLAQAIRGKESHDFLFGGREMPFPALLGRVALTLGETPESLAESLVVVLGVREFEPRKTLWRRLNEKAFEAFVEMFAATDGDELWVAPQGDSGGSLISGRTFAVRCFRPEAAFEAWGVADSSWGKHGVLSIQPRLDVEAERPVIDYGEVRSIARWSEPHFRASLGDVPLQMGMEDFLLHLQIVASRSSHPVRAQLLAEGLVKEHQTALVLVAAPNLGALPATLKGPGANNVLGANMDAVFSGCQSAYSAWSAVASRQLADEWATAMGGTRELESLSGATEVVLSALGGILDGGLHAESKVEQGYGNSVAEWIGSVFCADQAAGAGLVREVIAKRLQGEPVGLEVRKEGGATGLVVTAHDENGNTVREERLY